VDSSCPIHQGSQQSTALFGLRFAVGAPQPVKTTAIATTNYCHPFGGARKPSQKLVCADMKLSTELHQQPWCCFSLHKLSVDLV